MGRFEESRRQPDAVEHEIRFGRFRLHPRRGLTRGRHDVHLTPKSLAVLRVLVERPGEVISKDDLFRSVWPDTAVSDAALTSCIQELRHALGDAARHPRFIETVHRRGYRFVARTGATARDGVFSPRVVQREDGTAFVGREDVLETMLDAFALAEGGARQVLFVCGEPGAGKTTVVAELLARITRQRRARTAIGHCLERFGAGEPFQALLDALTRLCRQPGGGDVLHALRQCAPSWLAQLPPDLSALPRPSRMPAGTTPERMLRELNDALEAMTRREALVLCLEDLHWSDLSTLEWLGAFAQRPEPARVLLVGTFRSSEVADANHPLGELAVRLRVRRVCREIALRGLDESAVAEYIARRYPATPGASEGHARLARLVHHRTGGNPLFVVNVVSDLAGRGLLVEREGTWTTHADLRTSDLGVPDDVRRMIDRQIERLPSAEQRLLEVASVAGATFSSAAVAAGAHRPLADVEPVLTSLARSQRFLRQTDPIEWPDGTIAAGFAFQHDLYREVLYERIPAGQRAEWHREIGTREERAYGDCSTEVAVELAMHFEQGRDVERAVAYLQHAADSAQRRSAYKEARLHYERALALVDRQAAGRDRTERELLIRIGHGSVLVAMQGWAARDVEDAYLRAHALCRELGETPRLFPALWGLWLFYWGRGPLTAAQDISERLLTLAREANDRTLLLQAHHAAWATAFSRGDFETARSHAAAGVDSYDVDADAELAATYGGHDAAACARQFDARALAFIGRTREAVEQSRAAIRHAESLAHPFSLAIARVFAAAVDHARRDPMSAREHATAAARIAREQEFRLLLAWASVFAGWVSVEEGCSDEGLRQVQQGVADALATGSQQFVTHFLGMLAEAQLRAGGYEAGLHAIDEALDVAHRTGERFYEAELYRLRGELLLGARPDAAVGEADAAFSHALDIARRQGAMLLAVRSAISRARLWQRLGRHDEARRLLQTTYGVLDEATDAADFAEAQALLDGV